MALTIFTDSTTTRSTRSTTTKSSKTTTSTSTTTTKTTTRNTTRKTGSTTTKSKLAAQPLANNEKENINPFTGLSSGPKKQVKAVFGQSSKANTTASKEEQPFKAANAKTTRPQTRSITSPAREEKKSGLESPTTTDTATVPKRRSRKSAAKSTAAPLGDVIALPPLDDTLAGRLLASRQLETDADRRARELTVRPLADLSEAFNLSADSIRPSEIEVAVNSLPQEEETHEHTVVPSDLTAALRLLMASDESARLPSVVRKRGVKRTLSSRTSDPTPVRTRATSTSGTPAPRPTKRLRTAQSQPSLSSQQEIIEQISYPIVPPNSPARSRASTLPSLENIPSVFTTEDTSDVREENEEWLNEYTQTSLFENTQGSSHFSGLGRNSYGRSRESLSFDFSFSSQL